MGAENQIRKITTTKSSCSNYLCLYHKKSNCGWNVLYLTNTH